MTNKELDYEEFIEQMKKHKIKPTRVWINFMKWCKKTCPYGEAQIKLHSGQPVDIPDFKPRIRLDTQIDDEDN